MLGVQSPDERRVPCRRHRHYEEEIERIQRNRTTHDLSRRLRASFPCHFRTILSSFNDQGSRPLLGALLLRLFKYKKNGGRVAPAAIHERALISPPSVRLGMPISAARHVGVDGKRRRRRCLVDPALLRRGDPGYIVALASVSAVASGASKNASSISSTSPSRTHFWAALSDIGRKRFRSSRSSPFASLPPEIARCSK